MIPPLPLYILLYFSLDSPPPLLILWRALAVRKYCEIYAPAAAAIASDVTNGLRAFLPEYSIRTVRFPRSRCSTTDKILSTRSRQFPRPPIIFDFRDNRPGPLENGRLSPVEHDFLSLSSVRAWRRVSLPFGRVTGSREDGQFWPVSYSKGRNFSFSLSFSFS